MALLYKRQGARRLLAVIAAIGLVLTLGGLVRPLTVHAATGDINTFASVSYPTDVAVDAVGNAYTSDLYGNRVDKIDPSGTVTLFAGDGNGGYSGDNGPATTAELNSPFWVAVDAAGNVLIDDFGNNVIRSVSPSGIITTVAGTGTAGYSGDGGPAVQAELNGPGGIAALPGGGFIIADKENQVVRKVDSSGKITTVAGNAIAGAGYSGDNGPATSAQLWLGVPDGLAADTAGDIFIVDAINDVIRRVDSSGIITTIAGNGTYGYSGDGGPATSAEFFAPTGIAVRSGSVFVSDTGNHRVRQIDATGTISTVAGNGDFGSSGDGGPATAAAIGYPYGLAFDANGNLLVAGFFDNNVRIVTAAGLDLLRLAMTVPQFVGSGQQLSYTMSVGNPGMSGGATGVTLTDPLPAGTTFFGATTTQGSCTAPSGTVTCALGNLPVGATAAVTVTVTAPSAPTAVTNTATVSANEADPAPADNTASALTYAGEVDLSLSQTASSSSASLNQPVTLSMTIGSRGPATGVTLTDALASNVSFVSATQSQGTCSAASGTVTCALGAIADGGSALVTVTVNPATPGQATNTATVSADQPDIAPGDNSATANFPVAPADLGLSVAAPVGMPLNQQSAFTVQVGNAGPTPATSVTVTDTLPSGVTYVAAAATQGTCARSAATVTCSLGTLAASGSASVTITVSPLATALNTFVVDSASVTADPATSFDPNPADNSGSARSFVNPAGCNQVITANTKLSADIGPCYGDGVIIGADGITLDLNGHSIVGTGSRLDDMAGIRLPVRNFVTIKNGSVSRFAEGVFISSGGGNTVSNMNIHDNIGPDGQPDLGDGVLIQHSAANKVLNNTITHNGVYDGVGIFGLDADFNLIQGNTISKSVHGGNSTDGEGIATSSFLENSDPRRSNSLFGNNFIGNTIVDNAASGISSVANVNGQYLNNDIERNGLDSGTFPNNGIGLQPERISTKVLNLLVQNNKIVGNGSNGIEALGGVSGSQIKNNTVTGNDVLGSSNFYDLTDRSGACGTNNWTGNTYGAAGVNPPCLAATNTRASGAATSSLSPAAAAPSTPAQPNGKLLPRGRVDQSAPGSPATSSGSAVSPAASAASSSTAPSCGSVVTASIILTADIGPCSGPGLIVGADNVSVDLGGHKIVGSGVGDGVSAGVYVFGHQGVTVKNGDISGFDAGVAVYFGAYDSITNLNVHDNIGPSDQPLGTMIPIWYYVYQPNGPHPTPVMGNGIAVYHSFAVNVVGNTVTHNGVYAGIGIYGVDATANLVKGNTVTNTIGSNGSGGAGIVVTSAFEPNDVRQYLPIDADNVVGNTVKGNQGAGIVSLGNLGALVKGNDVETNGIGTSGSPRDGIQLNFNPGGGQGPATMDSVLGNSVRGSGDNGIAVYSGGNTIQGNTVTGDNVNQDGSFDLFDSHPACDGNTWKGNTSGAAGVSPSCA